MSCQRSLGSFELLLADLLVSCGIDFRCFSSDVGVLSGDINHKVMGLDCTWLPSRSLSPRAMNLDDIALAVV
jgi:hypothetical protein